MGRVSGGGIVRDDVDRFDRRCGSAGGDSCFGLGRLRRLAARPPRGDDDQSQNNEGGVQEDKPAAQGEGVTKHTERPPQHDGESALP